MKSSNKNKKLMTLILGVALVVLTIGITYAFINLTLQGSKRQVITAGTLSLELDEDENNLTIQNALPMYDEVGMIQTPFTFRLKNNGTTSANYKIKLVDVTPDTKETDKKCSDLGEITASSPSECRSVSYPDELRQEALEMCQDWWGEGITEEECLQYEEKDGNYCETFEEFIDNEIENEETLEDIRVLTETYPDNYVTVDFPSLNKMSVRYGLTKDGVNTYGYVSKYDSATHEEALNVCQDWWGEGITEEECLQYEEEDGYTYNGFEGFIDCLIEWDYISKLPQENLIIDYGNIIGGQTIEYEYRMWIDNKITDNSAISGKSLSFKIDVEIGQEVESTPSIVFDTMSKKLGEKCTTYNDGTDTFLVGQCSNNYVWYSGKLWRVVLKNNETGAVKMVTDNAITQIAYNNNNSEFEDSYADQWLNQEFLPTLHDYEDYLVVNSVWDATLNSSNEPERPDGTTTVERTVGLLNAYEYFTTYNQSGSLATGQRGYLNDGTRWWLLTPYNSSKVWFASYESDGEGYFNYSSTADEVGIRPCVNLKASIQIESGTGAQEDPYILKGDVQETLNGTTFLNTRYSGEYITFNNELYRIVGVENGLTKITAVDKPVTLANLVFDSSDNKTNDFTNATIKTDLENYYQGLKTTNETAFNMIEPDTTWYLGALGSRFGEEHYKLTVCDTVDVSISILNCIKTDTTVIASIALPRVGEMFTSQVTRNEKTDYWTLTPYSPSYNTFTNDVFSSSAYILTLYQPTVGLGARPSMYLKSNIVIASDNTGNGTYEKPYSLEIGV